MVNSLGERGKSEAGEHTGVRIPVRLKRQLEELAKKNKRSLSAEIVALLAESIERAGVPDFSTPQAGDIEKRVALVEEALREFGSKEWFLEAFKHSLAQSYLQDLVKRLPKP